MKIFRVINLITVMLFLFCGLDCIPASNAADMNQSRLVILADMGNEPDEEQQMVHMLMCSNEFEIEGLIAVTGKYLRSNPRPDLFHMLIDGYAKVVGNLSKHAEGWPEPDDLHQITKPGQSNYGIADVGDGKSSPGSDLLIDIITKDDPRPVYVVVNAGSNTLAQALHDYSKFHSNDEVDAFVSKLRVFENGSQDNCGAVINHQYPDIHWVRSNYQTYCYGGPSNDGSPDRLGQLGPHSWQPYEYSHIGQHQWSLEHIIAEHGHLGRLFPLRLFHSGRLLFLEGGGTIPWMGLVQKGVADIDHPHWGGWSGRYTKEKVKHVWSRHEDIKVDEQDYAPFHVYCDASDEWTDPETGTHYHSNYAPVWRWRRSMFNDFKCRMDWCVESFDKANHHPKAIINGDDSDNILFRKARAGEMIQLDASSSTDPDGDSLSYLWWMYRESGTYDQNIPIHHAHKSNVTIMIPEDAGGKQVHVILEVNDDNQIASLYDFRRIVIDVE
jgi:hypothetical protein